MYSYILLPRAQEEYEASVIWYLEGSVQAAEKFVNAIESTLDIICRHPYRWRNPYKNFHQLNVAKYPFTIIYTCEEDELIVVSSIFHHKRNPRKKFPKE